MIDNIEVLFCIALQIVELKVEMVGIHEKRLRKCLAKLKGWFVCRYMIVWETTYVIYNNSYLVLLCS